MLLCSYNDYYIDLGKNNLKSKLHRSVVELSYNVASRSGLENEVVSDLAQAINYRGYNG